MEALIEPVDELSLPRVAQLVAKTNQFNVTTRRHGTAALRAFMDDDRSLVLSLRLRDRFADHGLVAVLIAREVQDDEDLLEIDTWVMSCRVIGRTVENAMLRHLCEVALERGRPRIRGVFIPSGRNTVVRDLFEQLGFSQVADEPEQNMWEYDVLTAGVPRSEFIGVWGTSFADA